VSVVYALAGAAVVFWVLTEAFESLVLPRRVMRPYRITRLYYRTAWRAWNALAALAPSARRREGFLGMFGPLSLLALIACWAASLIVGFGLMHKAVSPDDKALGDSLYLSGVTFTTLGYGDQIPTGTAGRVLAVAEAGTGFGFFAVVIGYLPVLYQAFSRREAFIALLDARAGSPPAGGRMLLRLPASRDGAALDRFLAEAERWAAELLEGQLSFPVLGFYRSQHENQSWLAALTCVLDAGALLLTVAGGADRHQARLTFAMARHAIVDLALVLRLPPRPPGADRLPAARLGEFLAALRAAGAPVREDETATKKLSELRGLYEPFAAALSVYFRLGVPAAWPEQEGPDNWSTSAGMRRAGPLGALGADVRDEHFD
jgi:hypothetical protein